MDLNYIDIIIIGILFVCGIKGFCVGFIRSLFGLLKYILSLFLCKVYYKFITQCFLNNDYIYSFFKNIVKSTFRNIQNDNLINIFAKGLLEIIVVVLIFLISNMILGILLNILEKLFKFKPLNILNKLLGFLFGSMKGLIILLLILTLMHPFINLFQKEKLIIDLNNSLLLKYLYMYNFTFKYFNNFIEIFNKYNLKVML